MSTLEAQIESRYDDPDAYSGNRPPDWEARRKMVYRHDNWTCQACGRQSGPHAGDEGFGSTPTTSFRCRRVDRTGCRIWKHCVNHATRPNTTTISLLATGSVMARACIRLGHCEQLHAGFCCAGNRSVDRPRCSADRALRRISPMAVGRETVLLVGATLLGSVVIISKPSSSRVYWESWPLR